MTVLKNGVSSAISFFVAFGISKVFPQSKSFISKNTIQGMIDSRISHFNGFCDDSGQLLCCAEAFFKQKVNSVIEYLNKVIVGSLTVMHEFFLEVQAVKLRFQLSSQRLC